jgi:hypothetical protein
MDMTVFNGAYKLRWDVLKRDKFTCQYCGQAAPNVKLEIDHIIPLSNGGTSEMGNLITSCYACNRGKRDTLSITVDERDISRKRRQPLVSLLIHYLSTHEPATASTISRAIDKNRGNISSLLNNHPSFVKVGHKGRDVYYGLQVEL